jgi:hypothetical protein
MQTTRRQFLTHAGGATASLALLPLLAQIGRPPADAQAIAGAQTFTGTATTTSLGPVSLNAGLTVMRVQFNGTGHFSVSMIQPGPGQGPSGLPVTGGYYAFQNSVGPYKGAAVALVTVPGGYYLQPNADGAFQLTIEQPLPETVTPVQQTSFSGKGPDVSAYFTLPTSVSQISCQTSAKQLVAYLYHLDDLGGSPVVAGLQGPGGTIFDYRDPANQTTASLSLPDAGPYLLAITNVVPNDPANQNTWTVSFA